MRNNTSRKGFTLAELLIVVAILGVLMAVALPMFTSSLEKAKLTVDRANFRSAETTAALLKVQGEIVLEDGTVVTPEQIHPSQGQALYFMKDGTLALGRRDTAPKDAYRALTTDSESPPHPKGFVIQIIYNPMSGTMQIQVAWQDA